MEPTEPDLWRLALASYVEGLETISAPKELGGDFFPYNVCPLIEQVEWRTPRPFADYLVDGELRELTNTLNHWRGALRRWHVWITVLDRFSERDAWALQWGDVEALAFQCLFYPSATRDRLTFVATNALHQVRMALDASYPDRLAADPKPGKEDRLMFMRREQRELQLEGIASPLDGSEAFVKGLRSLDGNDYRNLTKNFRNLASHAIAPRLSVGQTNMVMRRVVAASQMVMQPDGTYHLEGVPGKQHVSYGFGGTEPLQMREIFKANVAEFEKAGVCFYSYVSVLNGALQKLPKR